uniref:Isopenicillin N synthase-like Fe(2+) 2OG dioxygenase domain-containing protein n=1 Tax=Oryza meridionalis TaxID=40149 RepID=A0A0E0DX35_9ORYZ
MATSGHRTCRAARRIMSNGIFKSPVHRVVTNAMKERLSVGLFYDIDPEKEIEPAAQLYKKVKSKDYTAGFYGTLSSTH